MRRTWVLCVLSGISACGGSDPDPVDTDTDDTGSVDTGETADTSDTHDTADTDDTDDTPIPGFAISLPNPPATPPACDSTVVRSLLSDTRSWRQRRSCGFASLAFGNQGETVAVHLQLDVDDSEARQVGDTFYVQWSGSTAPSGEETTGSLRLEEGTHLLAYACNDAISDDPDVTATWQATAGWMQLEVTASDGTWEPWGAPFTGTVRLRSVVLTDEADSTRTCTLPDLDITDASLGWLPG